MKETFQKGFIIILCLILMMSHSVVYGGTGNEGSVLVEKTYAYQSSMYYREGNLSSGAAYVDKILVLFMRKISLKIQLTTPSTERVLKDVTLRIQSGSGASDILKNLQIYTQPGQDVYEVGFELTDAEYNQIEYHFGGESNYTIRYSHNLGSTTYIKLIGYGDYQVAAEVYVNNTNGVKTASSNVSLDPYRYNYYVAFQYARTSYVAGFDFKITDTNTNAEYFRLKFKQGEYLSNPDLMHQQGNYDTARLVKQKMAITAPTTVNISAEVFSSYWGAGKLLIVRTPIPRDVSATVINANIGENTPAAIRVNIQKLPTDTVVIRDANTGAIYYQNSSLTGAADIIFQLPVSARDYILNVNLESGGVAVVTKQCTINKREVLTVASTQMSLSAGQSSIMVITDGPRYYEDNALNRALVQEILKKGKGIYFISSYVSPVLQPLLK